MFLPQFVLVGLSFSRVTRKVMDLIFERVDLGT